MSDIVEITLNIGPKVLQAGMIELAPMPEGTRVRVIVTLDDVSPVIGLVNAPPFSLISDWHIDGDQGEPFILSLLDQRAAP